MRGAALLTALAAAILIPAGPPGIGVPLTALLMAASVLLVVRGGTDLVVLGPLALALASMAAIRDAGWVVAIDVVYAALLAAFATAGARLTAPVAPLLALRRLSALAPRPEGRISPALRGALAGGLLAVPFGALFWTGDAAFASLGRSVPVPGLGSLPGQTVTFALVLVATVGLALARDHAPATPTLPLVRRPALEWAVPLGALNALFLAFVGVQASVLFAGHDYVVRTTGLTYSEYARRGFWQLMAVAALVLAVVGVAVVVADTRSVAERRLLHALLGLLAVLTLLVVASALHRLRLYEAAFGLSRLRLLAEAGAIWLGGLFVLLLLSRAAVPLRRHAGRIVLAATAVGLLAFTLADPDRMIARRNVDRWRHTGLIDAGYLASLSADAVPVVASLPEPIRSEVLTPMAARLGESDPWGSTNVARSRARTVAARLLTR
jgi:Domain of unknown function (DUF4173)